MKERSKTFDRVFKEQAVQLSCERSNISKVARELGITTVLLYQWRKDHCWDNVIAESFFKYLKNGTDLWKQVTIQRANKA